MLCSTGELVALGIEIDGSSSCALVLGVSAEPEIPEPHLENHVESAFCIC